VKISEKQTRVSVSSVWRIIDYFLTFVETVPMIRWNRKRIHFNTHRY